MARIVQKFGGTSVADIERIKIAAEWVKAEVEADHQVAVTVSAMAGVTDELVGYVDMVSSLYDAREYDVVVSAGEQVTSGLLALVLQNIGVDARSWLGWQIPVFTDSAHGKARISRIKETQLVECMEKGQVPVIAGFQGVGMDNRVTTLGRGGTDTSAVALAAAVNADRCDIYTDVDGIYTTDPRIVPTAQKLEKITYEEMLEMASVGAKVLQTRAVEMAMKYNQIVQVRSSFSNKPGTLVVNEEEIVEQELVSGIAYSRDEAKITLVKVLDKPGVAAAIFGPLADASINVDMIVQSVSEDGEATNLTFTVATNDLERTVTTIKSNYKEIGYEKIISDSKVAKVSVVGVGMRTHAGVAQKMFQTLAEKSINIQVISTSEIKVSVLIDEEYTELAVRALHSAYGLDSGQ
ncbi:MAG: aspartate kinase [Magnetovibrio sp.]|nr:aspartate kinase [Magnetovibrio sp.]